MPEDFPLRREFSVYGRCLEGIEAGSDKAVEAV